MSRIETISWLFTLSIARDSVRLNTVIHALRARILTAPDVVENAATAPCRRELPYLQGTGKGR
eukprot:11156466-Lingulodinium_polyedra.AAC.1